MRNDIFLFDLNRTEALLCDGVQLITARIQRRSDRKPKYRTFAFNRHGREAFLKDTRSRGIELSPKALSLIDEVIPTWEHIRRNGEDAAYADMYAKLKALFGNRLEPLGYPKPRVTEGGQP